MCQMMLLPMMGGHPRSPTKVIQGLLGSSWLQTFCDFRAIQSLDQAKGLVVRSGALQAQHIGRRLLLPQHSRILESMCWAHGLVLSFARGVEGWRRVEDEGGASTVWPSCRIPGPVDEDSVETIKALRTCVSHVEVHSFWNKANVAQPKTLAEVPSWVDWLAWPRPPGWHKRRVGGTHGSPK